MSIEVNDHCNVITGDDIAKFRLLTLYRALKLQSETGLKLCRISATKTAQSMGFQGKTAKSLLKDLLKKHPELAR